MGLQSHGMQLINSIFFPHGDWNPSKSLHFYLIFSFLFDEILPINKMLLSNMLSNYTKKNLKWVFMFMGGETP
jgi:hypothetical protein